MTRSDRLRRITLRWIEEGWRNGNPAVVDELHAPDFVDHAPAGRDPGNDGFRRGIEELHAAFPDFSAVVEDLVVDALSGTVAVRWVATGTHRGSYLGAPASGNVVTFAGIEIVRIRDDRITERWGEWDGIGLLRQLGRI